jgi:heme exporter protein D
MLHLDAGRYAVFIWPAYGLSAVILLGLVAETVLRARRWRLRAEAFTRDEDDSST